MRNRLNNFGSLKTLLSNLLTPEWSTKFHYIHFDMVDIARELMYIIDSFRRLDKQESIRNKKHDERWDAAHTLFSGIISAWEESHEQGTLGKEKGQYTPCNAQEAQKEIWMMIYICSRVLLYLRVAAVCMDGEEPLRKALNDARRYYAHARLFISHREGGSTQMHLRDMARLAETDFIAFEVDDLQYTAHFIYWLRDRYWHSDEFVTAEDGSFALTPWGEMEAQPSAAKTKKKSGRTALDFEDYVPDHVNKQEVKQRYALALKKYALTGCDIAMIETAFISLGWLNKYLPHPIRTSLFDVTKAESSIAEHKMILTSKGWDVSGTDKNKEKYLDKLEVMKTNVGKL